MSHRRLALAASLSTKVQARAYRFMIWNKRGLCSSQRRENSAPRCVLTSSSPLPSPCGSLLLILFLLHGKARSLDFVLRVFRGKPQPRECIPAGPGWLEWGLAILSQAKLCKFRAKVNPISCVSRREAAEAYNAQRFECFWSRRLCSQSRQSTLTFFDRIERGLNFKLMSASRFRRCA